MTDRALPGAIDSIIRPDETAQVFGQFSDGWVVPGSDPTDAAVRRSDIDDSALDAFSLSTSASSFDVTVAPGEAFVGGWVARDVSTTVTVPSSSTADIVLGMDVEAVYDPDTDADRDAADRLVIDTDANVPNDIPRTTLWTVETDGSGVTGSERGAPVGPAIDAVSVEADEAQIANRDVANELYRLSTGLGEARFDLGLQRLNYSDGFFDTLDDESLVASKTDVTGFSGSVTVATDIDFGTFSSPYQTLDFAPSSVVVAHTATERQDAVAENGSQFEYEIADGTSVSDATATLTGSDSTDDQSVSTELADGESLNISVGGNEQATLTATVEGTTSSDKAGSEEWSFSTGGEIGSSPAVADGTVYVGSDDNNVYAIDAATGAEEWSFSTGDNVGSSPAVADGTVYVGSDDANLYALDADTGSEEWTYSIGGSFYDASPTVADGTVYIGGAYDDALYALDADTGSEEWSFSTPDDRVQSTPEIVNGIVYFGSHDSNVYAVDAATGAEEWSVSTGDTVSSPAVADGIVYAGSDKLYALDADSGSEQWSFSAGTGFAGATVANGTVYVGNEGSNLYAIDAETGSEEWSYSTGDNIYTTPAVVDGTVYISSWDNNLYAVDAGTGSEEWSFSTGGRCNSSPTVANGAVYVGSNDANLYAVSTEVPTTDPQLNFDGSEILSQSGELADGETISTDLSVSQGDHTATLSTSEGKGIVSLNWTETTKTVDPAVTISSDEGDQTVSYSGSLADGSSVSLGDEIDESLIGGSVTVSVTVSDSVTSPVGQVGLDYQHEGIDAGGLIKYRVEDADGNSVVVEDDEIVDVAFSSPDIRVEPILQDGFASVELFDYALYTDN